MSPTVMAPVLRKYDPTTRRKRAGISAACHPAPSTRQYRMLVFSARSLLLKALAAQSVTLQRR